MDTSVVLLAGIVGLLVILAVSIHGVARLRIEQQRTLQKLLDRGAGAEEFARAASAVRRS
jgi:hypothetical protein